MFALVADPDAFSLKGPAEVNATEMVPLLNHAAANMEVPWPIPEVKEGLVYELVSIPLKGKSKRIKMGSGAGTCG